MSVNKVILVGRLGQDPELKSTPSGASVSNFSLATNENWMDKSGQKQTRTEWHRIVAWGKTAELCNRFLRKGREVYIEGSLQTRSWEDQSGQKRYTTEIRAQSVQFLGGRNDASAGGAEDGYSTAASAGGAGVGSFASPGASPSNGGSAGAEPSFTEDDIPF